jgi:hypothetical protein
MSYDVDWDAVADDLAAVWMSAVDRAAVTTAVHRIDQQFDPA